LVIFGNPELEVFMAVTLKDVNALKFLTQLLDNCILNQVALQAFDELEPRNARFAEVHFHESDLKFILLLECQFFLGDSLLYEERDWLSGFAITLDL